MTNSNVGRPNPNLPIRSTSLRILFSDSVWQIGLLFLSLVFCIALTIQAMAKVDAVIKSKPQPIAEFSLTDADGQPFGTSQFKGGWSLVAIGFTHCPDVCPFTLQNLAGVREELSLRVSPSRLPQVVFIGVDPVRDAPIIGKYVRHFGEGFIGVTGDWENVVDAVEAIGGYVRIENPEKSETDYRVFHSANVIVVDPKGRIAATINPPMPPAETATTLAELMLKFRRTADADLRESRSTQ